MAKLTRLTPLAVLLAAGALHVAPAAASTTQQAILQDDVGMKFSPDSTAASLSRLGVGVVKVTLNWDSVAPARRPKHFNPADPASPAYGFAVYDAIDRAAAAHGLRLFFSITGPAPSWADAPGEPRGGFRGVWKPSDSQFSAFVTAVGLRYSGHFAGLPAVNMWSIWNEANYGFDLAPQAIGGVEVGAVLYRGLLGAGWKGLMASGHSTRTDTILIGETAPHGNDSPGIFNGVKPLRFLRALYCVDSAYRPLRGSAARARGCPTTASGTRAFARQNPALFQASGFAAHLYSLQAYPHAPNVSLNLGGVPGLDPDFADLATVGRLERALDHLTGAYGSRTRFGIFDTEYGYRTQPPDPRAGVSLATQALYLNWAEYLHWRDGRIKSYDQYLLTDPANRSFASGLEFPNGKPKPSLAAYELPLFLPTTSTRRGRAIEVWGAVRPALEASAITRTHQFGIIQYRRGNRGAWTNLQTFTITSLQGYFDLRLAFPASGAVRLAWTQTGQKAPTHYSRTVLITVR